MKKFNATYLENLDCNVYFSDVDIVPKYVVNNGNVWRIDVPSIYTIKKIRILVEEVTDKIIKVKIDAPHPNASLYDGDFCLPKSFQGRTLDENSYDYLIKMLSMWNIDSCYFIPGDFKYQKKVGEKLKSLFRRK